MQPERHITWQNFEDNYIKPDDPASHIVEGSPRCEVFVESQGKRIGLRIAIKEAIQDVELPYQHINTNLVNSGESLCVEVSCEIQSLYEQFYAMIVSVADLVQKHHYAPIDALQESAQKYFSLLAAHNLLSQKKQIGLWCELWVLEKLITIRGVECVRAWLGPLSEPHDFRLDNVELEVKGTTRPKRSHLISNETQLIPSAESDLYIFSIQLALASGEGAYSLAGRVGIVADMLAEATEMLSLFNSLLSEAKYYHSHQNFYNDEYKLRTRPALVPVTDATPRITSEIIKTALGAESSSRLSEVKFRLDVTDLGFEEDSHEFQSIIQTINQ